MKNENKVADFLRDDRTLFSSLLRHIGLSAPNEDSTDFILASIGRNVGADRCYAYRFWEPGKSSMCTNTHEWCVEGIAPVIGGQQTCNLAELVEFNACITSGRDFMFTDIGKIDAGSREWLAPQGIKSLIAAPVVGNGNKILGFVGLDFVKAPCKEFTDRIIFNIHGAADMLLACQLLHERDMAIQDVMRGEKEYEENEREFERTLIELQKDVDEAHPKHMLSIVQKRMDADLCYIVQIHPDSSGVVAPENLLVRNGWTNTRNWAIDSDLGRVFDTRLKASSIITFHDYEFDWIRANSVLEDSLPACLADLKILHCFGVRNEGKLVGVLCVGYNEERRLSKPLSDFLRRAALVAVTTIERIATYHDLAVALRVSQLKGDVVEFMFKHSNFEDVKGFIGEKVCEITGAQHFMFVSDDGSRSDWFGKDAPACCHDCVKASSKCGKCLPQELLGDSETMIVRDGEPLPKMNQPPYCPMRSFAIAQFRKGNGWWQLVADYTKQHNHNMAEVARGLRTALEFLSISYDRDHHEKTIARMQEHQRFRVDALSYALSKDDLPGLFNLIMHRLLELTECDYIAIHSAAGDHLMLHPGEEMKTCPGRCESCSFYKLMIPPVEDSDHIIELNDTKRQKITSLPADCPAKSLEVIVVYCDGKPWGGIALHYVNKLRKISDFDRQTLKIAADVITLALERHAAAVRLKEERDRVVEAEKSRSYFFSSVSHDIRTPLNAIIGFSELLEAGGVSGEEAKQNLRMIVSSGKTLLQLINDVLDLSRMDLGKLEFNLEPSDVGELVREMIPMFQLRTKSRNQSIVMDVPELPQFMVDQYRFRQVLFNFIGNAVKYAGPCTIRIAIAYDCEKGVLTTTVADDGKGVDAEKAKRLMQPFVQADIKNRSEGSGLGLAICKRLVELAHGTISIDTAPGKGFSISTHVPVAIASKEKHKGGEAASKHVAVVSELPKRILVVDDSTVNRAVLKAMLKRLGIADIELAENGRVALDRLEEDQSFDMVLSDMWMPVMDGIELIKRIRADERLAKMKVCSITADVEALTTYKEQGFDSLLLKPVTLDKLKELFAGTDNG